MATSRIIILNLLIFFGFCNQACSDPTQSLVKQENFPVYQRPEGIEGDIAAAQANLRILIGWVWYPFKFAWALLPEKKVVQSGILPVPVQIDISERYPALTKARLRRDLCKILGFMCRSNQRKLSFLSDALIVRKTGDSYPLFAYSCVLREHNIDQLKTQFSDGTKLRLHYDAMSQSWDAEIEKI